MPMADGSSAAKWRSSKAFFGIGALRLVGALVALTIAGVVTWWLGGQAGLSCPGNAHSVVDVELAGTVERSTAALAGCTAGAVHRALQWDVLFILWYVVALAAFAAFVAAKPRSRRGGFRVRALRSAFLTMVGAAIIAGVLDLIEDGSLWAGLHGPDGSLRERAWAASTASTVGWGKFVLIGVVLVYVLAGLVGWVAMPARHLRKQGSGAAGDADRGLGICLSGGGVRAGTFGLGVLQVLDQEGLVDRARWLSAVSGGSYMAGAWAIARRETVQLPDDAPRPWSDDGKKVSPEVVHLRSHLNYLFARDGGFAGAIVTLVVGLAVNVVSLFLLLWLVARPLGWLIGWLLSGSTDPSTPKFTMERRLWLPVAIWAASSGVAFLLWAVQRRVASVNWPLTGSKYRNALWKVAAGALEVSALLAFLLIAAPAGTSALPALVGNHAELLRLGQVIAGGGVTAAVIGVLRKPLGRALPRLGGVLVLLLAVIAATEIAAGGATRGLHADVTRWLVLLGCFAVWYYIADPDWWSLQPYYRARLREAYATCRTAEGTAESMEPSEEPELSELGRLGAAQPGRRGPELLVCTAMNVTGSGPIRVGVPAYSFTFSPSSISFHEPGAEFGTADDYAVPTERYAKIFRRWDTPRLTAMTAVGMSGAAVSSAMGRFNYGSTKALLALANVRLGMWMPNPRFVPEGELPKEPGYPRRRLSYLVKEMFGVYDSEDIYVYLTDGGHWENLGLVELLRRRCREIVCVDASGSTSISFGTIAEAITLAAEELGVDVELPYEPMRAAIVDGRVSRTVLSDCAMGLITYPSGELGVLWYLKASLKDHSPARLLAFKEQHDIFPSDPTSDQLFDREQFEMYRQLGQNVAGHFVDLRRNVLSVLGGSPPSSPLPLEAQALIARIDGPLKDVLLAPS